ncbi:hypothetical protein CDV55_101272 [Aspergillus turcosus]|nr:hypothetical protein CDV55_101272 [Aspergillus turcosus]
MPPLPALALVGDAPIAAMVIGVHLIVARARRSGASFVEARDTTWGSAVFTVVLFLRQLGREAYPWGKPALALQRTLVSAPGYTKDAMYTEAAMKALYRIENWYFAQTVATRKALSSQGVEQWTRNYDEKERDRSDLLLVTQPRQSAGWI